MQGTQERNELMLDNIELQRQKHRRDQLDSEEHVLKQGQC